MKAADLWGTIGRRPRSSLMQHRGRLWIMMTFAVLAMIVVAGILSAWWVVPHWAVGGWSARIQFILRSDETRSRWVRAYADALGSRMDHGFSDWLVEEFRRKPSDSGCRRAIIRFFALRAERNCVIRSFLDQNIRIMPEIVAVQRKLPADERLGVAALLHGLCRKEGASVSCYAWLDEAPKDAVTQSAAICEFFGHWATLPEADRQDLDPARIMVALGFLIAVH